jgi:hypothetical protein
MCPACLASIALPLISAGSSGALAAAAPKIVSGVRRRFSEGISKMKTSARGFAMQ